MNQLEKWHESGLIEILMSEPVFTEVSSDLRARRGRKASAYIQTVTHLETDDERRLLAQIDLDWSVSPYVATYFAAMGDDEHDGELWAFDRLMYQQVGKAQWKKWRQTTTDGSGSDDKFDANLTAFLLEEPPPWFIAIPATERAEGLVHSDG